MRKTTVRLGLMALVGLAVTAGLFHPAGAEGVGRFSVSARSDVASVEYVDPAAPVVPGGQVLFATPATAQAVLDSLGASQAFAGAPYPGDFAVNFPNTANGLTGAGLPDYPFYASSSHPAAPESERRVGLNALSARSGKDSSVGEAQTGLATGNPSVASAVGRAQATRQADTVMAEASSSIDGFALGTTLRLGRISTLARLTVQPGSPPVKETSVSVASVTIAGQTVGFTEQGLVATDKTLAPPVDVAALDQILAQAGIELRYVPAVETPSSITSASLRVAWTTDAPGRGPVRMTMTIGQVRVSAEAEPAADLSLPDVAAPADAAETTPSATAPSTAAAPAAPADGALFSPGPDLSGPATLPTAAAPAADHLTGGDQPAAVPLSPAGADEVAQVVTPLPVADSTGLYLAFVAAGLIAVTLSRLMSRLAISPARRSRP